MATCRLAIFGLCVAAAVVASAPLTAEPPPAKPAPTLEELMQRLDSEDFATREAAVRSLLSFPDAEPALRRAVDSGSPEVQRLAKHVLEERDLIPRRARQKQAIEYLRAGEVDLFVEQAARIPDQIDDLVWQEVLNLSERLVARASRAPNVALRFPKVNEDRGKKPTNHRVKLGDYPRIRDHGLIV